MGWCFFYLVISILLSLISTSTEILNTSTVRAEDTPTFNDNHLKQITIVSIKISIYGETQFLVKLVFNLNLSLKFKLAVSLRHNLL